MESGRIRIQPAGTSLSAAIGIFETLPASTLAADIFYTLVATATVKLIFI
jgi:hypothetical protein